MSPHPKHIFKHCLRCGSDDVNYLENDSLRCNACNFEHFVNSAAAVAILITNEKGELLLTKRAFEPGKGKLDLPGGFVDVGESVEQAVQRELQEELALESGHIRYLGSYPNEYEYSGVTVFTLDMAFVCKVTNFTNIRANDDVADFAFYPVKSIPLEEIALRSIRNIVTDFIELHLKV